jgi:hypothetical protein
MPDEVYREYLEYIRPYQLGNSHPGLGMDCGNRTIMTRLRKCWPLRRIRVIGSFSYVSKNMSKCRYSTGASLCWGFRQRRVGSSQAVVRRRISSVSLSHGTPGWVDLRAKGLQGPLGRWCCIVLTRRIHLSKSGRVAWPVAAILCAGSCE